MKTVVGLFDERAEAQRVYDDLTKNSFSRSEITLVTSASDIALGNGDGIPAADVRFYQQGVQQGGSLVVARVDDSKAANAANVMARYKMVDVDARVAQLKQTGADVSLREFGEGDHVLPVIEEQIAVGKRSVEGGRMRVYSTVTETPVEQQVTLHDETVSVERHPVSRDVTSADLATAFKEQSFELRETREEAVIAKTARVIEEVVIGKQGTDRIETIRDTVRRTDVNVEELPSTGAVSTTTTTGTTASTATRAVNVSDFGAYDTDYRTYYTSNLSKSGYTYEQMSPVYRYGYDLANDSRYSGKDWATFESDAHKSWEERNPGTWDQFKDTVRYAWDKARGTR